MAVNLKIVSQVVTSGTPGPAGKSAYQIAVDNGFKGTESAWLKELHPFKGWFDSVSELEEEHSAPSVGEYAYVKGAASSDPVKIYECSTEGSWSDSGRTVDTSSVQTFGSGEAVNDVDITNDSSEILEGGEKIPTASAVAGSLGNAEFSTGEKVRETGIDDEPTAGSDNLVRSGGIQNELALGAVYDVSAKNPTSGPNSDGKWESLSTLLSDANLSTLIPTSVRKGGMSIKFVQSSSDNKYIQYRLMADVFTTDTTQWAIAEEGVYMDNPEFVYVKTDAEDKILWGIKIDGTIHYGAGVPQQIIDYIQHKIDELSLDEYEDIVSFLDGLERRDKTLQELLNEKVNTTDMITALNTKVDKVEGKGLSENDYTDDEKDIVNSITLENAGDYIQMTIDALSNILEGITSDGKKRIALPLYIDSGEMDVDGYHVKSNIENPEFIKVELDNEGRLIYGVKKDGSLWCAKGVMADEDIKNFIADKMDEFPDSKYVPLLESLNRTVVVQTGGVINPDTTYKTLNLLTLADIHNSTPELSRFVGFANKYKDYLDDSIILGDIAGVSWVSYTDWDETVEGYSKVLKVLGNHDTYERYATFTVSGVNIVPIAGAKYRYNNYRSFTVKEVDIVNGSGTIKCYQDEYSQKTTSGTLTKESGTGDDTITFSNVVLSNATVEDCYNRYLKGIRTWGVSYIPNKCYYYKDYAKANVRLIVIDCMYFDDEQKEWLQDVLYGENNDSSALTLGRHVIIASHIQVGPFSSKKPWDCNFTYTDINVDIHNTSATNIVKTYVDTFQQRGGVFITYMFGHHHIDEIGDYTKNPSESYPNQIYIKYPTIAGGNSADTIELEGNPEYENVFTVTSIDTRLKLIRLLRIGVVFNRHLVHRESIVISYEDDNRRVISQY